MAIFYVANCWSLPEGISTISIDYPYIIYNYQRLSYDFAVTTSVGTNGFHGLKGVAMHRQLVWIILGSAGV